MIILKIRKIAAVVLAAALISAPVWMKSATAEAAAAQNVVDAENMFTNRDMEQTPDLSSAEYIEVTGGAEHVISAAGTYVLSGTAQNAVITVEAPDDAKVQLVLENLNITNADKPAVYVKSADKVFITVQGENTLRVEGAVESDGSAKLDGVIFSRCDLVLNGTGTLNISSAIHGIVGKDDLKITGGNYYISAASHGIEANDSIRIAGGNIALAVGEDGLHSENDDDLTKGYVYISGGELVINARDDGIHAKSAVQIDGGTLSINAAEGIESTTIQINDGFIDIQSWDDGINAAYKTGGARPLLEINGGELTITMAAGDTDGIDSNGDLRINGGITSVTGTSTFDVDGSIEFNGGTVYVNGEQVTSIPNQMMGRGGWGGFGGQGGFGEQGGFGGHGGWRGGW